MWIVLLIALNAGGEFRITPPHPDLFFDNLPGCEAKLVELKKVPPKGTVKLGGECIELITLPKLTML